MNRQIKIATSHIFPPIPFRGHDWLAWIDGEDEGIEGRGETKEAAERDLMDQVELAEEERNMP